MFLCPNLKSVWFCFPQVWAWKENVWEKEKGTLMERYTVEQSKPQSQGGAVLSTLTINNVMESDFHSPYNCTAWNSFGPGTMIITLEEKGMLDPNSACLHKQLDPQHTELKPAFNLQDVQDSLNVTVSQK